MTAIEVTRKLHKLGATKVRQVGSHARFVSPNGKCFTTVPMHRGDIPLGTLRAIEKQMTPCLGEGWLIE